MSVEKALEKTIQDERASPSLLNLTERRETENENNSLGLAEKAKGKGWASSLDNLSKIISGDSKLKEKLRYNEFTHEIDIIGSLKLNSDNGISGVADDSVLKEIRLYIAKKYKVDFKKIFPMFILYFIIASIITTIAVNFGVPAAVFNPLKTLSKFFIVLAMSAIGLNTNIVKLVKTGAKPLLLGFSCWIGITCMSLLMQHVLGLW